MLCVSAKPVFPKQTCTLSEPEDSLPMRRICRSNWGRCVCTHMIRTWEPWIICCSEMFRCISVSLFSLCLPTEPLLHLTSVFVPVLLRLFPAGEYVVEALWGPNMLWTWKRDGVPRLHISLSFWMPDSFPQIAPPLLPLGCVSSIYLCTNLYYTLR